MDGLEYALHLKTQPGRANYMKKNDLLSELEEYGGTLFSDDETPKVDEIRQRWKQVQCQQP